MARTGRREKSRSSQLSVKVMVKRRNWGLTFPALPACTHMQNMQACIFWYTVSAFYLAPPLLFPILPFSSSSVIAYDCDVPTGLLNS